MAQNTKDNIPPAPAYFPTSATSSLHPPKELYARLKALSETKGDLIKIQEFLIPPRSGHAWRVPAGTLFRLSTPFGSQVGDLNVFNASDPRERFWAARTRQLQGSHVQEGDRLWSNLPFMRPLCGVVEDGCEVSSVGREERRDERGGVTNSNLVRALLPYGLTEFDVHDVLNVFQVTGLDSQGRYFMEASPATPDSTLTFFAEQSLLCALSTCPGGDLSAWGWHQAEGDSGDQPDMKSTCRPIKVEVFQLSEGVKEEVLKGWREPEVSSYAGLHGMTVPGGEA
ncbi:uncharacterized protein N0V89_000772 [Didymosphaeria variabile]|uniref:DUF1989 domain-containing protein n=1 Tax=Didymosphaeria variabile TaxID=1932322 RepID=A0A9W9CG24_9PLEO|nr:uncharacterized protein N0V89_000772 [Didymosphaeria variabile]KAJ4360212.1 hypothetical protein N0V89_000772 [Didymosphaeria variabile]